MPVSFDESFFAPIRAGLVSQEVTIAGMGSFTLVARQPNESDSMRELLSRDAGERLAALLGIIVDWKQVFDANGKAIEFSREKLRTLALRSSDFAAQALEFAASQFPKRLEADSKNYERPQEGSSLAASPTNQSSTSTSDSPVSADSRQSSEQPLTS